MMTSFNLRHRASPVTLSAQVSADSVGHSRHSKRRLTKGKVKVLMAHTFVLRGGKVPAEQYMPDFRDYLPTLALGCL
jgi:hypothetical protein